MLENTRFKPFDDAIKAEVDRVMEDPLFKRSPVQSRLLSYLCQQTINRKVDLSQYEIAVDGLGRPDDYDLTSDSYPRVQVSRLRNSLAAYYARNLPRDGQCVYIRQGGYKLRLAPPSIAYPDQFDAAEPEFVAEPVDADILSEGAERQSGLGKYRRLALIVALVIALVIIAGLVGAQLVTTPRSGEPPIVAFRISADDDVEKTPEMRSLISAIDRNVRRQLATSFVSRLASDDEASSAATYSVVISLGEGYVGPDVHIRLYSADNMLLYSASEPLINDQARLQRTIQANVIYLIAPNGVVARNELTKIDGKPLTPYECFISIESNYAQGKDTFPILNSCIKRFPEDRYASFWYARKAYFGYQARIERNEPITRDGIEWQYVRKSLEIDEFNAFGNFVAAKASLAQGDCARAGIFIDRTLERGTSYPGLIAAALVDGSGCASDQDRFARDQNLTRTLIENNPAPNALLHMYMLLAALSVERPDIARLAADRIVLNEVTGPVEETSDTLRNALVEPGYFQKNRSFIQGQVGRYVWNKRAQQRIMQALQRESIDRQKRITIERGTTAASRPS